VQGCILSPFLFLIVINFLMSKTGLRYHMGSGTEKMRDLEFTDDTVRMNDAPVALKNDNQPTAKHGGQLRRRTGYPT